MSNRGLVVLGVGLVVLLGAWVGQAKAAISVTMIGDNDGFGFGKSVVPDGAPLPQVVLMEDRRSAAEKSATNGAQQTDLYSALFTPLPVSFDAVFPLAGPMLSGVLEINMGGFQASSYGRIAVQFNGVSQPSLLSFEDGVYATRVRDFTLGQSAIDNANAAGQFVVHFDRSQSRDAMVFDYFQLTATTAESHDNPEPSALLIWLLLGSLGIAGARWRKRRAASRRGPGG